MSDSSQLPDIQNVIVLMLENRSFDCMLGSLYPPSGDFDGLKGTEFNIWHKSDGGQQQVAVWTNPTGSVDPSIVVVPDPDPGELFDDIHQQITGVPKLNPTGIPGSPMGGFVDNYMGQPSTTPLPDSGAVMHYFTEDHVPVISQLARAYGVSDRWHASAPCQTWPNRLFVHTGTAGGSVNNSPAGVPFMMDTVFDRLGEAGKTWEIYYHDFPQSLTLGHLWGHPLKFHHFDDFLSDAASGSLANYTFIEPRYFADLIGTNLPNDEHPPHNVAYGEQLITAVYNAVRSSPHWQTTLLIITYDEHGGCYDHVVPPAAVSPGAPTPDGFDFELFGVRVPAVIISPFVKPSSIIRPQGSTPFDHTSIFKTLQQVFGLRSLTSRSDAAPGLLDALTNSPDNDGPGSVTSAAIAPAAADVATAAGRRPNDLQQSLSQAAVKLPTKGADVRAHIQRVLAAPGTMNDHAVVGDAAAAAAAHMKAFVGEN